MRIASFQNYTLRIRKKYKGNLNNEALGEVLLERERLCSTGIGDGIAIPFGKIRDLDELILLFGRSAR